VVAFQNKQPELLASAAKSGANLSHCCQICQYATRLLIINHSSLQLDVGVAGFLQLQHCCQGGHAGEGAILSLY
jgi:hypothetical protein